MSKPTVFISYSHKDEAWKDRLVSHLGVLQHEGLLDMWDDRRIGAGQDWYEKIQEAIDAASVAILLVSADFLTSKFILSEEVPSMMERREKEGLRIFPVIIRPCAWKQVKWLARMNLRPKDGKPISGGTEFQIDADMTMIAEEIAGIIKSSSRVAHIESYVPLAPEKISLAKLPSTNPELFGREKELKMLDEAWANPKINIVSLVAWGGVGKTALVNTWLRRMEQDNFRGAERVFGWSFYSQGASEGKPASADVFIASALRWFGDTEPEKGTPWEKGERLAECVKKQKTLLILDGIEPLQAPSHEPGKIKDPALSTLVRELDILRMMGLFDSPAEGGAIEVLRADPPIKGLTSELKNLSDEDWCFALDNLRKSGLLAREDPHDPDTLDCHPLIREHFGEKLRNNSPEAWKEAHGRLYEYYKSQAKEYPDTIEEMLPLYRAVAHGCRAGRYQEALDEVYWKRILRSKEHFSWKKLGTFGAELAAISSFFKKPWSKPVSELNDYAKAFVLNMAGYILPAFGRLAEAAQPIKAGVDADIAREDWKNAAISAGNLSELYLTMGDIAQALDHAEQSVELADRSGDTFLKMGRRAILADALHQAGSMAEAGSLFKKVEEIKKNEFPEEQTENIYQYHFVGIRYCDILLSQGKYQEVLSLARNLLEKHNFSHSLLDIALDYLSLGRAHLLQAFHEGTGYLSQAAEHLNQAVDWLRRAGTQHYLPRGLLARSELYIAQEDFEKAKRDLDEAMTLAERGEMGLYKADCRLGYTRLYLAAGDKEKAREELAAAKGMIQKMGYHRRDGEVKELGKQL